MTHESHRSLNTFEGSLFKKKPNSMMTFHKSIPFILILTHNEHSRTDPDQACQSQQPVPIISLPHQLSGHHQSDHDPRIAKLHKG